MRTAMLFCIAVYWFALQAGLARADDGPVYAMIGARLDARLDAYSREPVVAENADIPVQDEIVNASGQAWTRLCLRLEHLNAEMTAAATGSASCNGDDG